MLRLHWTSHKVNTVLVFFVLKLHGCWNLGDFKQGSHAFVIQALAFKHSVDFAHNSWLGLLHLLDFVACWQVFSFKSFQLLMLDHYKLLASLDHTHQLLFQFSFWLRQVPDVFRNLVVVQLQPVSLVLRHPFPKHVDLRVQLLERSYKLSKLMLGWPIMVALWVRLVL